MFVIYYSSALDLLKGVAAKLDYFSLFSIVFIGLSCLFAAGFALRLAADKKIRFSPFAVFLIFAVGAGMFSFAFLEYLSGAKVFDSALSAALYAGSEICALTVLYAVFFGFAHKSDKEKKAKNEAAVSAVSLVRCRPDARGRVYAVVTKKMGDGVAAGAKVDFGGVYAFLKEAKESGKNLKEIEAVERSISFYDGVKIDRGTLSDVNNLFLRALKLAAE